MNQPNTTLNRNRFGNASPGASVAASRVRHAPLSSGGSDTLHFGSAARARTAARSAAEGILQDPNTWPIVQGLGMMAASTVMGLFAVSNPLGWMASVVLIPASIALAAKGSSTLDKLSSQSLPGAPKGALSHFNDMRMSWFKTNTQNAQHLLLGYNRLIQSLVSSDGVKRWLLLNPRKGLGALIRKAMRIKGRLGQVKADKAARLAKRAEGNSPSAWFWRAWNAMKNHFFQWVKAPFERIMTKLPLVKGPVLVISTLWQVGRIGWHWFGKTGRLKKADPAWVKQFVAQQVAKTSRSVA